MNPLPKKRRLGPKLLAVLLALVLTAALAEVALRIFGVAAEGIHIRFGERDLGVGCIQDADLLWRLAPREGRDPIHAIGIRGAPFDGPGTPRDVRICCVGDSCTYGLMVEPHESWGMLLDRRLQARFPGACVETVIAAAPGYSTFQNLALLRRNAAVLAGDVTVLFVGVWNDLCPAPGLRDSEYAVEIRRLDEHPFWSLRLGRLAWRAFHPIPTVDEMRRRFEHLDTAKQTEAARVSLDEFGRNVEDLVRFGRAHGAVVALLPCAEMRRASFWSPAYHGLLVEIYRDLGVPCFDVDEAFQAFAARHPEARASAGDFIQDDHIHPTALGHAAIAELIEPAVGEAVERRGSTAFRGGGVIAPVVSSLEPRSLPPGRRGRVRIHGSGFGGLGGPRSIHLDGHRVSGFRVTGDSDVELDLEPEFLCMPGPTDLEIRSRAGVVHAHGPEVLPWNPEVTIVRRKGRRVARLTVDSESCLAMSAWIAPARLDEPRATRWGPFYLADPKQAHPDAAFEQHLTLRGLGLPRIDVSVVEPAPGPRTGEVLLPDGFGEGGAGKLEAQVLIRSGWAPSAAWLSPVIAVRVAE